MHPLDDAVKASHPEITVIGTVGPGPDGEDYTKGWQLANQLNVPIVDEHYYSQPQWFVSNQYRYDAYSRNASRVYVGEYASWGNKMQNALSEALYMTSLERNGDIVAMASYAPLLAKEGFTQWHTDMIYFDKANIYPSVNYYVQKLFSNNHGDIYFGNVIIKDATDSTLAGSCVQDSATGDVILKLVNAGSLEKNVKVNLTVFKKLIPGAVKTELGGNPAAMNVFGSAASVLPVSTTFTASKRFDYVVGPLSLTVIRIKTKGQSAVAVK